MSRERRFPRWLWTIAAVVGCAALFGGAATVAGRAASDTDSAGPGPAAPPTSTPSSPLSGLTGTAASAPPSTAGSTTEAPTTDDPTVTLPPLGTKVAVVGDSLTDGLRTRLPGQATRYGFSIKLDAQTGRTIEGGLEPLKRIVAGQDLVVVALGTNDARPDLTITEAESRINEMLALVSDKTPVLWVNVYRNDTKNTADAAQRFDAALQMVAEDRPNVTVLDWSTFIQAHTDLMGPDHIHLTAKGYDERAAWLADAIAAGLRLPPVPPPANLR
jgi:lysophospholipase L1-like esterase